jgi:hypothetical protein
MFAVPCRRPDCAIAADERAFGVAEIAASRSQHLYPLRFVTARSSKTGKTGEPGFTHGNQVSRGGASTSRIQTAAARVPNPGTAFASGEQLQIRQTVSMCR